MSPISLRICKLDLTDTLIKLLIDWLIDWRPSWTYTKITFCFSHKILEVLIFHKLDDSLFHWNGCRALRVRTEVHETALTASISHLCGKYWSYLTNHLRSTILSTFACAALSDESSKRWTESTSTSKKNDQVLSHVTTDERENDIMNSDSKRDISVPKNSVVGEQQQTLNSR